MEGTQSSEVWATVSLSNIQL